MAIKCVDFDPDETDDCEMCDDLEYKCNDGKIRCCLHSEGQCDLPPPTDEQILDAIRGIMKSGERNPFSYQLIRGLVGRRVSEGAPEPEFTESVNAYLAQLESEGIPDNVYLGLACTDASKP